MLGAALSCLLLLAPGAAADSPSSDPDPPRILILNSFNASNAYTQAQMRGILSAFPLSDDAWNPFLFQDLDYHARLPVEYEQVMVNALGLRFRAQKVGLVITTDTRALEFMMSHGKEIFPRVPVVFSAAITPRDTIATSGLAATGVRETVDVKGTIEFMKRLQPDLSRILVVYSERSDQAVGFKDEAMQAAQALAGTVKVDSISPTDTAGLTAELTALGPNTAVLYTAFLSSGSVREELPRICAASAAPVYCLYDVYVGFGPIGGHVSSAEILGREAGALAKRVLAGQDPRSLPIRDDAGLTYMIDYTQLSRWAISPSLLPPGTITRNAPPEFLRRHRGWLIGLGVAVAVQTAVIGMLLVSRRARRRAENELSTQRQRLEQAVVGSNFAIWDWDVATERTVWRCGLPSFLDGDCDHQDPNFWSDRLHPDDRERALDRLRAHLERSEPYDNEYRLRLADGSYRWFRSRGTAVRDPSGKPLRMLGTLVDVHDRVTAQQQLRASEVRFRLITETSDDFIVLMDRAGNRLYRSPAAERVFSFSEAERTSTDPVLRVHPDDRDVALAAHEAARRGESVRFELRAVVGDGSSRWVDMHIAPAAGVSGLSDTYICYGRDITERKQAEQKAKVAEERYRAFVAHCAEGICRIDLDSPVDTSLPVEQQLDLVSRNGVIAECNDAFAVMHGHQRSDDMVGVRLSELLPHQDPANRDYLRGLIRSGYRLLDQESHELDRAGSTRVFLNNLVGIVEDGRLTRVWGTQRDITRQRQSEQLREERTRILQLIARLAPLKEILAELVASVQRQSPGLLGSFLLLGPDGCTVAESLGPSLPEEYCRHLVGMRTGPDQGCCGRAMSLAQRVIVSDIDTDPLWAGIKPHALRHGLRSCWSEPIIGSDGRVLGSFAMYTRAIHAPDAREIEIVEASASLAAIAIERDRTEQALLTAEHRFRAIFEQATVGIFRSNADGRYLEVNPGFCKIVGRSREQLLHLTSMDITHPDDLAPGLAFAGRAIDAGESSYTIEKRYVRGDGTPVHLIVFATILRDAAGNLDGFIGIVQDISDRKRFEHELERYFTLSLSMLCIADTTGYFKRINPAFLTTLGYSESDLLNRPYLEFVHPDDRPATQAVAAALAEGVDVSGFENRYLCADGSYRRIAWRAALVKDVNLIYASARDVTEERAAAEALARSEAKYRRIIETTDEGVWLVDHSWRTTFVNARMAGLLGYRPEDMLGRHIFEFMDDQARAECQARMERPGGGDRGQHDFRFRHADGTDVWTLKSVSSINDDNGQFVGALVMVTDITARRAAEEALRATQATNIALLGAIPDLVFRMDRNGRYLDFAGPPDIPLMVPPEEFLGRTAAEVLSAERAEQCMQALNAVFSTGLPQTYEYEAGVGDNTRSWEVRVVRAATDQALLLIRNISDRRRAEAALRLAEERYRSLVERLPLVVYSAPRGDAEPTYVSPQFRDITGLPPERLLGGRLVFEKHIHPDDRERVSIMLRRAEETAGSAVVEYRLMRPDGNEIWLREQVVKTRTARGAPDSVQGLILDITATKKAEEALRDNQRRLSLLVSNAPFGMIAWNTRFEITQWNPAAEKIFGYSAEQAIGRCADLIVSPQVRPRIESLWRQLTARQGGYHSVNENTTRDRGTILCEWNNVPFYTADGSLGGVASFVQDVTQKVNAERRQALMMRELDHRVKNNMAAVLSLVEQTGRASRSFDEFHAAFAGRVRALSRLHTALARTQWKGADLRSILQQTVEPYSGNDPDRLVVDGPSVMLPPRVAQALTMSFNELATNASKYGALSRSGGRVHVQWSAASPGPELPPESVAVCWKELGGPPVAVPERRGFGMDLVEGAVTYQLGGEVVFDFPPEGLCCRLVAPLTVDETTPAEAEVRAFGG